MSFANGIMVYHFFRQQILTIGKDMEFLLHYRLGYARIKEVKIDFLRQVITATDVDNPVTLSKERSPHIRSDTDIVADLRRLAPDANRTLINTTFANYGTIHPGPKTVDKWGNNRKSCDYCYFPNRNGQLQHCKQVKGKNYCGECELMGLKCTWTHASHFYEERAQMKPLRDALTLPEVTGGKALDIPDPMVQSFQA